MTTHALLVLVCGAFYEASCVGFIHSAERARPARTAFFSVAAAAAQLTGLLDSVRDWRLAPFFIFGYGIGSYIAVWLKGRRS
jgi:hypothetical protein